MREQGCLHRVLGCEQVGFLGRSASANMARMNEQEEALLRNALRVIRDGWEQFGISQDDAIRIVVNAIAGRSLISASDTPIPPTNPFPIQEPDDRPRKIILKEEA